MQYLVTTEKNIIPSSPQHLVVMVDGTVPGWSKGDMNLHFDHHRVGGADIQIDEIPMGYLLDFSLDYEPVFVTTQLDADACVAAAWLQLNPNNVSEEKKLKLRAIAYDCDHLAVPEFLADLGDFAAQAVAALKSEGFKIADEINLPKNRKDWTQEDKVAYASLGFKRGVEWLIDATLDKRPYPGELGEAAEYWAQVKKDEELFIVENRVSKYKDALIFSMLDWKGRYVDPRASLRAAKRLGLSATLTLTQRETTEGWSYTLASRDNNLMSKYDAFKSLTIAEAIERNVDVDLVEKHWRKPELNEKLGFDPWGGREKVGGSGWRTPSKLTPVEVIDTLMQHN